MVTFTFASAAELMGTEQALLPTLKRDNPVFSIFPSINKNTPLLMWEQLDNFQGMMSPRGLGGKPNLVKAVGSKLYQMQPGYYGEHMTIDERELTLSRQPVTFASTVDVTDLTVQRGNQLLHRQLKREAWIGWQLLTNGYFLVTDAFGNLMHADSYTQRIVTATVPWSTLATAAPLADFRSVRPLSRGFSISFGSQSTAYANSTTVINLLNNNNSADLGGKRQANGATFNSLDDINKILVANDCPKVVEWDGIWQDESGNNTLDIANNTVIVKGVRLDVAPIGNWVSTRNVMNPGFAPGGYYDVFQNPYNVPSMVEIHRGINGGISLYFPSAIVVLKV